MTKTYLLFSLLFLSTLMLGAQTPLPYATGFEDSTAQAEWVEYRLGPGSNPSYNWTYFNGELLHYYPVGGMQATDDWIVSPAFDFFNGGTIDSLNYKFAGFGTPQTGDTIALYVLTGHPHPDSANSQTIVRLYTDSTYANDNTWKTDTGLVIPASTELSYFAFRYKTIINWLDVSIDNLAIDGSSVAIETILSQQVKVFPNPVSERLTWELPAELKVQSISFFNMQGQKLETLRDENSLLLGGYVPGLYFLLLETNQGTIRKQILVK